MKKITDRMRWAASDAVGREIEDPDVEAALAAYMGVPIRTLRARLYLALTHFGRDGGNTVERSDEIYRLRVAIAARAAR